MSKGLTIEVQGLKQALNSIKAYKGEKEQKISDALKGAIYDLVAEAQAKVPTDLSNLKQSIRVTVVRRFEAEAEAEAGYAAYVEFGTGALVRVPKELVSYAMQFKGKGIKEVNLPARPYFYPAAEAAVKQFLEDIKVILSR